MCDMVTDQVWYARSQHAARFHPILEERHTNLTTPVLWLRAFGAAHEALRL